MELKSYLAIIEKFVQEYLNKTHCNGYVLGLSGGVDSSLVAAICKKAIGKDKLLCLILPIDSMPEDANDAIEIARELDVNYKVVDASESYRLLVKTIEKSGETLDLSTLGNLKARIRMSICYAYAQKNRYLVIGTDNKDERYTGYFTKYGDGGVDLLPIVHLTKGEVVEAAKYYGLSQKFAERVPTAGLFPGQTDEREMGITYADLDSYLLGNKVSEEASKRIEYLHAISEHKRAPIPAPEDFKRGKNEK